METVERVRFRRLAGSKDSFTLQLAPEPHIAYTFRAKANYCIILHWDGK